MATVSRENIGLLTDKITVQLQKEDYYPAFEKALKNYSKQAKIPGFRPGMVPMPVVKKMYGATVFNEEVLRSAEKEINKYLDQEKPEIFAQPLPSQENDATVRSLNMNEAGEYRFTFEIGLKPEFTLANLSTAVINRRVVEVTDAMLEEEISRLQTRFGNMKEPETVENEQNVLNLTFEELDAAGNLVENGVTKDNSLLVSYFSEGVRPQLSGLKVGDSLTIQLSEAFEAKELEWVIGDLGMNETENAALKSFQITITKIGFVEKRELDTDFFNQVFPGRNIETVEAFSAALREDFSNYWKEQSNSQVHDEIYHYLLDNTDISLPADFLKKWMMVNGEKQKSAEEVELEYAGFENSLKWNIISDRIIKNNQLTVEPEELRDFAKKQMLANMGVTTVDENMGWLDSYVDRMMQDKKYLEQNYHQLLTNKLFTHAAAGVTNFKDELVSPEEFAAKQHHHHY